MLVQPPDPLEAARIIERLFPKQLEIVEAIAYGATSEQICQAMGITYGTYRTHKKRIKDKMGGRPPWGWGIVLFTARGFPVQHLHEATPYLPLEEKHAEDLDVLPDE